MDISRTLGIMAATALWAIALTLMTVACVVNGQGAQWALEGWSLLTVAAAVLVTHWQLLERSRGKVMDYLAHQDLRMAAAVNASLRNGSERSPTPIR